MTRYEIVNPSDPYTIDADDPLVAAACAILIGRGQYQFEPVGKQEAETIPFFMFGGFDDWWKAHGGGEGEDALGVFLGDRRDDIIDALRSVRLNPGLKLGDIPLEVEEDGGTYGRSSLNDIGRRARSIAEQIAKAAP